MKRRITLALLAVTALASSAPADWKDEVGYTALASRLGPGKPTGASLDATQVEGDFPAGSGNYLPNTGDPQFAGKTINAKSGASAVSWHANVVAYYYYGLTVSISPGLNPIDVYELNHWLNSGFLRIYSGFAPLTESRRAQNHSWGGSFDDDTYDIDALRRVDLVAERDGVLIAAGVDNGAGSAVPKLLSSAYNALAVGLSSGHSSFGPTLLDTPGRVKPDIVAPPPHSEHDKTSFVTPIVAGASALLLESTDENYAYLSRTKKALLAKALLMAGATKNEFSDWRKGLATPCTDGTVPLDYRWGAGELNIDHSHRILTAGEQNAGDSSDVGVTGWDSETINPGSPKRYFFNVQDPPTLMGNHLSILLAWYRHISVGGGNPKVLTPSLANLDLRVYQADGFTPGPQIDQSISSLDNVEHIYIRGLPAGRYVFAVTTDLTWDYAVAWDVRTVATVRPDFDRNGYVDGDDLTRFEQCATAPGIPWIGNCQEADLDDDTDVDQDDFAAFQRCYSGTGILADPLCYP